MRIDTAKTVFQLHWVQPDTGEIHRKKLQRAKLMEFFARLQPCRIVMEACGRRPPLGPRAAKLGHQVELLPPHKVKESASGNKDDARDARAIWVTATHKDVRRVPVKTVEQQAELFTHRVRSHWVSLRTATVNQLRSMLYEYGIVAPKGRKKVVGWVAEHRAQIEQQVPAMVVQLMDQQLQALRELDERIVANERTLQQAQRTDETVRELLKVPGIGPLGATALQGRTGRRQRLEELTRIRVLPGTGAPPYRHGRQGAHGRHLQARRPLLANPADSRGAQPGARAQPPQWIADMLVRRPFNVVAVDKAVGAFAPTPLGLLDFVSRRTTYMDASRVASGCAAACPDTTLPRAFALLHHSLPGPEPQLVSAGPRSTRCHQFRRTAEPTAQRGSESPDSSGLTRDPRSARRGGCRIKSGMTIYCLSMTSAAGPCNAS